MKILVADDDPSLVRVLTRWLRSWGYETVPATNGLEAIRILQAPDAPRVAIVDWDMPAPNGVELCRIVRAQPEGAQSYVLMLTARQHKNDLVEALESGADDFLSKPFHPRELQLRLAKGVRDAATRYQAAPQEEEAHAAAVLGGKVRLERELARGAMGNVWLGVHLALGVNVAVKFMDRALAQTAEYATFEREARAAAQLRGENIVRVYDHGLARGGQPYLVMEYLDGETIGKRITRLGRLPANEVVTVVDHVARALGEAHGKRIIHRDVKPDNVVAVEEDDGGVTCKLIDFGLARPTPANGGAREALIAGTPVYMSPEYLRRETAPNPALDLWALAVSTFEMLTGHLPFEGESAPHVLEAIFFSPFPRASALVSGIPESFDRWFAIACAREPAQRFASAAELAQSLAAALGSGRALSVPPSARTPDEGVLARTEPDVFRA